MIYEIRTYTLKPRSLGEVEKRWAEAYEYRKKYSQLAAFWHTEIGPLNEIIHVWPYTDLAERARIRAEAAKEANWPPKIREFVVDQEVEVVTPFPFIPEITPGTVGPIFEIRRYSLTPGSLPGVMKRWEGKIGERIKLSPMVTGRRGGVRRGQPVHPHLGVQEHGPAAGRPGAGAQGRHVAAAGRRRRAARAVEQDHAALVLLAAPVGARTRHPEKEPAHGAPPWAGSSDCPCLGRRGAMVDQRQTRSGILQACLWATVARSTAYDESGSAGRGAGLPAGAGLPQVPFRSLRT